MDQLENILFGTYDPIWKSISIYDDNISKIEKINPSVLKNIVVVHENFHWLQLITSSLGHIISLLPVIHRHAMTFFLESKSRFDKSFTIEQPLLTKIMNDNETTSKMFLNDYNALILSKDFLLTNYDINKWASYGSRINQALFSLYDIYLMHSRDIIISAFGDDKYNEFLETNKKFWDKKNNYTCQFYNNKMPILGFRDLIECSARIVEIFYYKDYVNKYSILNKDVSIDDNYLYNNKSYFMPMDYIKEIFPDDYNSNNFDEIFLFLLTAIHISINPPIVPFYDYAWSELIDINSIHPGIRFNRLCIATKEIYKSCIEAINDGDFYSKIYKYLNWPNDNELTRSLEKTYSSFYNKIKSIDDGSSIITNDNLHEYDYYLYRFIKYNKIKKEDYRYFINPINYLAKEENLDFAIKINNEIHCPIIYDTKIGLYQVNLSGFNFEIVNLEGKIVDKVSTIKALSDQKQQDFLNHILVGIFYNLDNQLLNKTSFDLGIFNKIDALPSLKKDILELYNKMRWLNLTL